MPPFIFPFFTPDSSESATCNSIHKADRCSLGTLHLALSLQPKMSWCHLVDILSYHLLYPLFKSRCRRDDQHLAVTYMCPLWSHKWLKTYSLLNNSSIGRVELFTSSMWASCIFWRIERFWRKPLWSHPYWSSNLKTKRRMNKTLQQDNIVSELVLKASCDYLQVCSVVESYGHTCLSVQLVSNRSSKISTWHRYLHSDSRCCCVQSISWPRSNMHNSGREVTLKKGLCAHPHQLAKQGHTKVTSSLHFALKTDLPASLTSLTRMH